MIFYLLLFLILTVILYLRHIYTHWKRKGFPYITPTFPFGNLKSVARRELSFGITIYNLYLKTKEPFIGIYLFFRPAVLIRDPELVRKVLIQDFTSFHDRGIFCNEERDPMSGTLFALPGERWKNLRMKLTPAFSSGRLKAMFSNFLDVGEKLQNNMDTMVGISENVDVKEMLTRFSLDIIASVIFGLNLSTIDEPGHIFRTMSLHLTKPGSFQGLRAAALFLCPQLIDIFRLNAHPTHIRNAMIDIVKATIEQREKHNVVRKDFMQLLLQLRNGFNARNDDDWEFKPSENTDKFLSIEQCAAQVFVFYIAGSETSAVTISFCLFELGRSPVIMKRVQDEIDCVLKRHDGKITYESLYEMEFLDLCIKETLRKYPGLAILNRKCTKDFKIPNSDFIIENGTAVIISLFGIHHDPEIFPDPYKFDPYRFSKENSYLNERYYFPFGDGPRICIASRMGELVSKVGLVMMLMKFNFESINKNEIEYNVGTIPLVPRGGIPMKVTRR